MPPAESIDQIEVSILIVCYKSERDISVCLESIFRHVTCRFEILLLDNFGDGTVALVKEQFKTIRVVENSGNIGFGPANNRLAAFARGKYLLLLNPDTYMDYDAVSPLLLAAERYPKPGIWGGFTCYPDGSPEPSSQQFSPTLKNELLLLAGLKSRIKTTTPLDDNYDSNEIASGAFMLVCHALWRDLNGFDTSFFLYSEEVDFCLRARRQRNALPVLVRQAKIFHHEGNSSSNADRIIYTFRGKMHLTRKYRDRGYVLLLFIVLWLYVTSRAILGLFLPGERGREKRELYSKAATQPMSWYFGYR